MDLQDIEVGSKSCDTGIDRIEDMLPRKADLIHHHSIIDAHSLEHLHLVHFLIFVWKASKALRQEDDALARDLVFANCCADDAFGISGLVDVGL
jgi:hypothetical protein